MLTGSLAVLGGVQMIRDGFGMPLSWLSGTPLTSWALPGVLLLAGVAAPQLAVAAMIVTRRRMALAGGYLAGLILVGWIVVQVLVLQRFFFLQPVIAVLGLAETGLAWLWQRTGARGRITTGTFVPDRRGRPAARVDPGSDVPADNGRGARTEGQR